MKENFEKLPLRNGVGVVILNSQNKVFVAKRIDNPKKFWQMPQGGVNKSENYYEAALRELNEETSIKSVSFIKEIDGFISYNLPDNLLGIIWKGKFKGQRQKWFIMKFIGKDSEININTKKPEFLDWKWVDLETITDTVVNFKLKVYEQLKLEVRKALSS
jgi:putative (di)nucleoside polyphosphate hydrolase|tara:strand:- start:422 stop:901 length:480 start_codon:yes stop_codon:yes gene_type:complete